MKKELDFKTIDLLLLQFLDKIKKIDPRLYPIYWMLYNFGFRVNEVLELDRWKKIDDFNFEIKTEKGSHKRKIKLESILPAYFSILSAYSKYEPYCSYDTIKYRMQIHFPKVLYYSESKKICTHLFRHNYVKRCFANGENLEKISNRIGEVDLRNTEIYLNSKVYLMSLDEIKKKHSLPQKPSPIKLFSDFS